MSNIHYYLSTLPEALIASMLPPENFGAYLAAGKANRAHGPAMFFEVDAPFDTDFFDFDYAQRECVPHEDGSPKHSVYLGIYRVLEHTPLANLKRLYLATDDGRVLPLEQEQPPESFAQRTTMYAEICPVTPLVVCTLDPVEFCNFITTGRHPLRMPAICLVDIETEAWSASGAQPLAGRQPAGEAEHVANCIREVEGSAKKTKIVDRTHMIQSWDIDIRHGFFVGDGERVLYYPFPSRETLERDHHEWWRSACE